MKLTSKDSKWDLLVSKNKIVNFYIPFLEMTKNCKIMIYYTKVTRKSLKLTKKKCERQIENHIIGELLKKQNEKVEGAVKLVLKRKKN